MLTLDELQALAKKVVLVPLPADRSRGDQIENAKEFEGGTVIEEKNLNLNDFQEALQRLSRLDLMIQAQTSQDYLRHLAKYLR